MSPPVDRHQARADVLAVLAKHGQISMTKICNLAGYSRHVVRPILCELVEEGRYEVIQSRTPKAPEIPAHLRGLGELALSRAMGVSLRTAGRRLARARASTPPAEPKAPPTPTP